jgi:hypothetical protein
LRPELVCTQSLMAHNLLNSITVDIASPIVDLLRPFDILSLWFCGNKRLHHILRSCVRRWRDVSPGANIKWPKVLGEFNHLQEVYIVVAIGGELFFSKSEILSLSSSLEILSIDAEGSLDWVIGVNLAKQFPNLHTLTLDPGLSATEEASIIPIPPLPSILRSLTLLRRHIDCILNEHFPSHLTHLSVSGHGIEDRHIALLPRSLLSLYLGTTRDLTNVAIRHLPPKLTRLQIRARQVTSSVFSKLPPTLASLEWSGGTILRQSTPLPGELKDLVISNLEVPNTILGVLPANIEKFCCFWSKTIQELHLKLIPPKINTLSIGQTVVSNPKLLPSSLTILSAIRFSIDTDLSCLPITLKRLAIQFIRPNNTMIDTGFILIDKFHRLSNLTHLEMSSLGECADPNSRTIRLPSSLHTLRIEQSIGTTNVLVYPLPDTLTHLHAQSLSNLAISSVSELPSNLLELHLPADTTLNDDSIPLLPRSITILTLSNNTILTDACIKSLPRGLRDFMISSNPNFTDSCIEHLPKSLHSMTFYHAKFTPAGIEKFPARMGVMKTNASFRHRFYDHCSRRKQDYLERIRVEEDE